jgi:hypothetical protein
MKIAVVTLHRVFNYGSVLQAHATQKILEELGHEVEIVDYVTAQRTFMRTLKAILPKRGLVRRALYAPIRTLSIAAKRRLFGRFIRRHLSLSPKRYVTASDLLRDPPRADVYMTGSDQVWNSHYNEGIDPGFFLAFAPPGSRKVAYATSFGKTRLDRSEHEETRRLIHRYSAISVREDTALKILDDLEYAGATCLLDPTLQRSRDDWAQLATPRTVRERYLLLFLLYNEDNGGTEAARAIARQRGLKLVKLSWEHLRPAGVDVLKSHVRPEEFLSLFQNAAYVVTNSFHGLAFSINFNRQFVAIPRDAFNTRIESLLRLTGLQRRLLHRFDRAVVDERIDYGPVNAILEAERKKARDFLAGALEGTEGARPVPSAAQATR